MKTFKPFESILVNLCCRAPISKTFAFLPHCFDGKVVVEIVVTMVVPWVDLVVCVIGGCFVVVGFVACFSFCSIFIEIKVDQWMLIIEIVKSTFPCIHWYHNIPIVYHQQCSTTVLPHHHLDFYSNCDHWCNHLVSFPMHVANLSMTYIWVRPFKFSK